MIERSEIKGKRKPLFPNWLVTQRKVVSATAQRGNGQDTPVTKSSYRIRARIQQILKERYAE